MNRYFRLINILILSLLFSRVSNAQYILNGSAQQNSCNCYTLTKPTTTLSGSVWNSNKISLTNPFDFWFNVFLGCNDIGADGIVFILQPLSTNVGTTGEGMGFGGVSPSIGIALDTYQNSNLNDPSYDHISIQANGNINHNSDLAGPVPISVISNNVEDCKWHRLRITWDPASKWLRAYFDGILRVEKQVDLISSIFNNDPKVYWGFTGATGGQVNLQQFCTALDPDFSTNLSNNGSCVGKELQLTDSSTSFAPIATYSWDFGDGKTSNVQQPPPHIYDKAGYYTVKLKIKGLDGCENDTLKVIAIGSPPIADITVMDTCFTNSPRLMVNAKNFGASYQWIMDGNLISTQEQPLLDNVTVGQHDIQFLVTSLYQCGPPAKASASFQILPVPEIKTEVDALCTLYNFRGISIDNVTVIEKWNWDFGDKVYSNGQNPSHLYQYGLYQSKTWVQATNGCLSDTIVNPINITRPFAFAGNDTVVIKNYPFQLIAQGNGTFIWSPPASLSNATIPNPIGQLSSDQTYYLMVTTPQGCVDQDTIRVKAMEGPAVYIPSGFTPNNDGLNDVLIPTYVGISKLERFSIFNRWGEVIFTTNDPRRGWDGKINNQHQVSGSYVWIVKGENFLKQSVQLKGITTLIR